VPFRPVTLQVDDWDLKTILDAAGVTVNPYWDSCVSLEVLGWDPGRGDVDVFVHLSGSQPCPGDPVSRFVAIRGSKVVLAVESCGDCGSAGPDAAKYLAIRKELSGRRAIRAKVGGGARWGFDGFDEIVLGDPETPPATTEPTGSAVVSNSAYDTAYWQDGGPSSSLGEGVAFSLPSGNVVCITYPARGRLLCSVKAHDWSFPVRDCGPQAFQELVQLTETGTTRGICAGGIMVPVKANPLPYGASIENGGYRCTAAQSGLTCAHLASGKRFILSKQALSS